MTEDLLTRARELAVYIIETRTTIRQAAKVQPSKMQSTQWVLSGRQ